MTNGKNVFESNAANFMLFIVLLNYGIVHFCVLQPSVAAAALRDYGYISVLTIAILLASELSAMHLAFTSSEPIKKAGFFALAYVLQVYLWREADLHKFFTHKSVTSIRYYRSAAPLPGKFVAGVLLLVFIAAFAYILIKHATPVIKAFFRGEHWAVAVCVWGILLVVSQIWDKTPLNDEEVYGWRIRLIEEYLEFSAPVYLFTAFLLYVFHKRRKPYGMNRRKSATSP